jgi:WD40 repeat protein
MPILHTCSHHVDGLAVADDGQIAVVASALTGELWDGRLLLLRHEPGTEAASISASIPTASGNTAVLWAAPGLVAVGDDVGDVTLWRFAAGASAAATEAMLPCATYREHEQSVTCLACAPGGLRLASGSKDGTVKIWANGSIVQAEHSLIHTSPDPWCDPGISGIAFRGPDSIVSVSADGLIRLWDVRASTPAVRCVSHETMGLCSVASINETLLVAGTQAGAVICVDWRGGARGSVTQRVALNRGAVQALCPGPGAAQAAAPLIAAAHDSGHATVLNAHSLDVCGSVAGHEDRMSGIGWVGEPQGNRVTLVSGGWDKRVCSHALLLSQPGSA